MFNFRIQLNKLNTWLIPCGIFLEFYWELLLLVIILINIYIEEKSLHINKKIYFGVFFCFIYSIIIILINKNPLNKFIQQLFLIIPFVYFYSIILYNYKSKIPIIFKNYLKIAYVVAILGLLQFIIYFFTGFNIFQWVYHRQPITIFPRLLRITSIMDEAGYLTYALTPSLVYYIFKGFKINLKESFTILFCFLLTFSTVSDFILLLCVIYKLWLDHKMILISSGVCIFILVPLLSFNISENKNAAGIDGIILRIHDTYNGILQMDPHAFESLNASSYASLTNFWVAFNAPNRIIGTGLGTHEINYQKLYQSSYYMYGLNSKDGYSLLNRFYSEFGIIGCIVLLIFLFKNFNRYNIINISSFFIIVSFLIKGGHYVRYGLIFWIFLFYLTSKTVYSMKK